MADDLSNRKENFEAQDPYKPFLEGAKMGDRICQRELYNILSVRMFPVCLRYMGEREKAKDVLHDGFITLFSKLDDFRGEGSFEGWARRIFATTALMQLRRRDLLSQTLQIDGEVEINDAQLVLDPKETSNLDADKLMELILSMPDGFRAVFNLYALEGFSHKEISQMLQISEGASRSQLSRAKIWLQKRLKRR